MNRKGRRVRRRIVRVRCERCGRRVLRRLPRHPVVLCRRCTNLIHRCGVGAAIADHWER